MKAAIVISINLKVKSKFTDGFEFVKDRTYSFNLTLSLTKWKEMEKPFMDIMLLSVIL
jgi:hypothetical protein